MNVYSCFTFFTYSYHTFSATDKRETLIPVDNDGAAPSTSGEVTPPEEDDDYLPQEMSGKWNGYLNK